MLRRFWGSLGLSVLCPSTLGLSPKETNGTRARKGARGASGEPLKISVSASPRCLPACPRVDARIAKGNLQTVPHIVDAAPLRAQVSRAPPDWKAAPRLGSLGEPGARTRGGGAQAARGMRWRGPLGTPGGGGGTRYRHAADRPRKPRPRPARAGVLGALGLRAERAREGSPETKEVPRRLRRRRFVRLARRAAAALGEPRWKARRVRRRRDGGQTSGARASAAVGPGFSTHGPLGPHPRLLRAPRPDPDPAPGNRPPGSC